MAEGRVGAATIGSRPFVAAASLMALILGVVGIFLPRGSTGAPASVPPPKELAVTLTEFAVTPPAVTVSPGQRLTLTVTNAGAMPHDLKLDGTTGTKMLDPGATETVTIGPVTDDSEAWCTVPGHRDQGMVMKIAVAGGDAPSSGDAASGNPASGSPASDSARIDPQAEPAAGWKPRDPVLAPAPAGTTHNVTIRAVDADVEVAPGVTQRMWTFGGTVPGTVLRGRVGDVFNITLVNDGTIGHSIDFHASKVAWNDEMRTIEPGESLTYTFTAEFAGAFMYHCGTAPTLHHIANGMYGAIIIDPPGLAKVDHEYLLMQSELYLGPEGKEASLAKAAAEEADAVVFNGYVNQYKHSPIRVEPGERVRTWVVDDGPSENSAFHVVGTVFDTVWKEGSYLLTPDQSRGGSQVMDLQPAQGGFVEFTFAEAGLYPIVTHKFANVGKGALGLFQAGEVDSAGAGGH